MDLVSFLGWENSNGIYRSRVSGEFYRVVDNKLETFAPETLEWRESKIRANKLYKLKPMEKVGTWFDGFAIHNEEEWGHAKTYYLQKGYKISDITLIRADMYLEYNNVFYVFLYDGEVEATTNTEVVIKRGAI